MSLIDTLAQAIAQMEGYNVAGSLAQRNNNPGNLRESPYATDLDVTEHGSYCVFPDEEEGFKALYYQLDLYTKRGLTLAQMINVYAPAADNNAPNSYLNFVVEKLGGVDPNTLLSVLFES